MRKKIHFRGMRQHDDNNSIQIYEGRKRSPQSQNQSLREGHSYKRRTTPWKAEYFCGKCFRCNGYGYKCYECPNFLHEYHTNYIFHGKNIGSSLVIKKYTSLAKQIDQIGIQINALFRTTCELKWKCY